MKGTENIWEKETILSSPTKTKLTFTNSSNLQYDIDVSRNSYFFGTYIHFNQISKI